MIAPPRLGKFILRVVVNQQDRAHLIADLAEDYELCVVKMGVARARRWYWRQVLTSVVPSLRRRVTIARRGTLHTMTTLALRRPGFMDRLVQDLRFALRTLRQRPGFTAVAAATLALGIGANTAIFSLVNGVLFKSLPGIGHTEDLVLISRNHEGRRFDMSFPVFTELRERNNLLAGIVGLQLTPIAASVDGKPSIHMGMAVTGNYFSVLEARPALGRFFAPAESFFPDVSPSVVISHRLWENRFESSDDVLGKTLLVNGYQMYVIGVAPAGFGAHHVGLKADIFLPLGVPIPGLPSASTLQRVQNGVMEVLGRLKEGTTVAQAAAELSELADRFHVEQVVGASPGDYVVRVEDWEPVPPVILGGIRAFFALLMTIVMLVLATACVNVANMILSRATERRREIAVRIAMGASRARIVRQFITESLLLFGIAGTAGVVLAVWTTQLLLALKPPLPPGIVVELNLGLDWRVLGFSLALSVVTGVVFSLVPALSATRIDLIPALKDNATAGLPERKRLRSLMVGGQMAVTMTLLVVAGLFLRALGTLDTLDPGWNAEGVSVMSLDVELNGTSRDAGLVFYRELAARVRDLKGVEASGLAAKLPLAGRSTFGQINVVGVPTPEGRFGHDAFLNRVSPGYFHTLDVPLLQGRDISDSDIEGRSTVAVINRAMAERFWPNRNAVGRQFYTGAAGQGRSFEVVGVVENTKYNRLVEETPNFYYVAAQQFYTSQMTIHFRASGGAEQTVAATLQRVVRELDPSLPIQAIASLDEQLGIFFLPQRVAAWVAGVMGGFGLILGAVGVYGVTSFSIGQRTREIGVRIALGARGADVVRMMIGQGLRAPLAGVAVGLLVTLAITRFLGSLLAGVSPVDPVTFGAVVAGLSAVALLAILLPARRASSVDPMTALRSE